MAASIDSFTAPAFAALRLWGLLAETAQATVSVITRRSAIIDHAVRNPLYGDAGELALMLPEKISAFSRSSESLGRDWLKLQRLAFEQMLDLIQIAARPTPPSVADYERTGARALAMLGIWNLSAIRALAPIHATVTANARRLG